MSKLLISQYLNELAKLKLVSGTTREMVVREAFKDLLKGWAKQYDLTFIPEYELTTKATDRRYVDGALLHTLRVPFGYWEAKDSSDDLDDEIQKKFKAGYPRTNIIFEDSTKAVLFQNGEEVIRCPVDDVKQLEKLLKLFFEYQRPWEYRLGNRSALEWILDQYKEKKPKDPTIREKFDTYRFADYKEKVIDLLARVTTVSVETVAIVEAMRVAKR